MTEIKIHCSYDKLIPINEIQLNPKNRNKHPKDQIDRLVKIIKYNGVRRCLTVSNQSGLLVVGHGRIEAMKECGMTHVPVNFQDYETLENEYADSVADNAVGLWSELDLAGINNDLADLGPDFDLDVLGLKNFSLVIGDKDVEILKEEMNKKFILEVTFSNEMELMDIHDDLMHRGYIVKVKNK